MSRCVLKAGMLMTQPKNAYKSAHKLIKLMDKIKQINVLKYVLLDCLPKTPQGCAYQHA